MNSERTTPANTTDTGQPAAPSKPGWRSRIRSQFRAMVSALMYPSPLLVMYLLGFNTGVMVGMLLFVVRASALNLALVKAALAGG